MLNAVLQRQVGMSLYLPLTCQIWTVLLLRLYSFVSLLQIYSKCNYEHRFLFMDPLCEFWFLYFRYSCFGWVLMQVFFVIPLYTDSYDLIIRILIFLVYRHWTINSCVTNGRLMWENCDCCWIFYCWIFWISLMFTCPVFHLFIWLDYVFNRWLQPRSSTWWGLYGVSLRYVGFIWFCFFLSPSLIHEP